MARRAPALAKTTYAADVLADFTGGLNLGPVQQMPPNTVAVAKNVDFNARGGFQRRNGFYPFDYFQPHAGENIYVSGTHNRTDDATQQVIAFSANSGEIFWSSGGGWFTMTGVGVGTLPIVTTLVGGISFRDGIFCTVHDQFGDNSYFQNGNMSPRKWNGYVMTTMGLAFNDNIAAPTGANMPKARVIAAHREHMWLGYTDDGQGFTADYHPRRIRFSHPGQPGDWRSTDWIDVPQGNIRALLPFQDFLMVFTDDEIYGVYGSSADDFTLQRLSGDTGTPWAKSVTRGPGTAYWWDWDKGLMMYNGKSIVSTFGPLYPALQNGEFSWGPKQNGLDDIPQVFFGDGRVFVSKQVTPRDLGLVLVYDPEIGRTGAWTTYDWAGNSVLYGSRGIANGFATVQRPSNFDFLVVGLGDRAYIVNDRNYDLDTITPTVGSIPARPPFTVRTAPMQGSTNATKKRFRRPRMAFRSGATQSVRYRWVRDYDPTLNFYADPADFNTILLDNVSNRPTDYAVWDGLDPTLGVTHTPSSVTPAATKALVTTANATANNVATGSFSVSLNEVILVVYAAYDNAGSTMDATIAETLPGTVLFSRNQRTYVNGGKSAVMGGFITKCPSAGSGTVTVTAVGADDIAIAVYRLTNAQPRFSHTAHGTAAPASVGVVGYNQIKGDPAAVTANDLNFIAVVLSELTNSDIDLPTFTTDLEDNNADNILGFGSRQAIAGFASAQWSYVSGTNNWGTSFGMVVQGTYPSGTDGVWNTDLWGGGLTHEFTSFETQPSAGAGHVVQLEITDTTLTDAQVARIGTNGATDFIGMDSTVLPYREKGLR